MASPAETKNRLVTLIVNLRSLLNSSSVSTQIS
jgi:hypothetical protein